MRAAAPMLLVVFLLAPAAAARRSATQLDALTFAEHWVVYDVIRDSGRLPEKGTICGRLTR